MIGHFIGTLKVALVSESHDEALAVWEFLEDGFGFASATGAVVMIPKGFTTDFCSVPRLPGAFDYLGDIANQAGAVHDRLYTTAELPRDVADLMLKEMILALGYQAEKAELIYTGVRLFGGPHFATPEPMAAASTVIASITTTTTTVAMAGEDKP